MKIKRFAARDMRQVLRLVRDELGPDAVILSNRRTDEGIAVVAAVDYDGSGLPDDLEQSPPPAAATRRSANPVPASFYESELSAAADGPLSSEPTPPAEGSLDGMRREVQGLRELLECQLASLAWNELGRSNPMRVTVLKELSAMGLDPEITREVADGLPRLSTLDDAQRCSAQALVKRLPVLKDDLLEQGGTVAVVGATGVGKTTTVAKLAARYVMRHGPGEVCLLSTDTYRIGAREQLLSYARILGVPLFVAADRQELAAILSAQSRRKLVLIDTAGMSQRDARLAEQFELLRSQGARTRILLALSAASDLQTLDELATTYACVSPAGCVLTKLDESASLGAAMSVIIRHRLPLAWCTNGQRVPEDIHPAHNKRMWLVSTAMRLVRQRKPALDERVLARRFSEVPVHA
jgi:flagellar biosynthesis protein FlhF